jgi:hypothetical protein
MKKITNRIPVITSAIRVVVDVSPSPSLMFLNLSGARERFGNDSLGLWLCEL